MEDFVAAIAECVQQVEGRIAEGPGVEGLEGGLDAGTVVGHGESGSGEEGDAQGGGAADGGVVAVEGDQFRVVVKGQCGYHEVERTGGESLVAASLTEACGMVPEMGGRGQKRQSGELGFDHRPFFGGGVSQDLKGNRFAEASFGIQNPTLNFRLEFGWRLGSGEIDPERGFDQSRHCSARVRAVWRSVVLEAS